MEAEAGVTPNEPLSNATQDGNAKEKSPTPTQQELPKKGKKEDKNKRDEKNVDQFMKSLNSASSTEEKLSIACKKYVQTTDDNKKLQFYIKQSDKRYALLLKEKDQLQHEYNKTVLVKSKLENLCRELQKQNKSIKEESLLKIREEEERRKETQAKFQNTLSEITALLQQNNEKNAKLRDDNISMTEKFKSVVQQYQLREQQVDKMAKQMALESQLSDAKQQKASLEHQADRERLLAEMEQLKVTLAQYRAKVQEMQSTETALKGQLGVYTDKYDEFQNALVKSNQVFGGFKEQIDKMSKKISTLEKESASWKRRWETSQASLLDVCTERQASDRRMHALQGLCRTLQTERTSLVATLKEHNIERPPLPPPPPVADDKVDVMAANCAQLKQSLAHLQSQLNVLQNKKEEPPKPEKQKKSKSKKNKAEKLQKEKSDEQDSPDAAEAAEVAEATSTENNVKVENILATEEKVDTKTMISLLQAINLANLSISDLEPPNNETEKLNGKDGSGVPDNDEIVQVSKENEEIIKEGISIEEVFGEDISKVGSSNENITIVDTSKKDISNIDTLMEDITKEKLSTSNGDITNVDISKKDILQEESSIEDNLKVDSLKEDILKETISIADSPMKDMPKVDSSMNDMPKIDISKGDITKEVVTKDAIKVSVGVLKDEDNVSDVTIPSTNVTEETLVGPET